MSSTVTTNITEDTIDLLNSRLIWMENSGLSSSHPDMSRLEGNISDDKSDKASPQKSLNAEIAQQWDTLDEPILETLRRDIASIYAKLKLIVVPIALTDSYRNVLKDWDLWGPLLVTTFLALTLHHNQEADSSGTLLVGPHFAQIFVLIWLANFVVSLNYKLLSVGRKQRIPSDKSGASFGPPTTFQLVCVFGYCLTPAALGVILLNLLSLFMKTSLKVMFYEKLVIGTAFGFVWPTLCSLRIISKYMDEEKRVLAAYPIGLFYFVVSWALITTH